MSEVTSYQRAGRIAVVTIDNPPVNALSHALRAALAAAFDRAEADPEVGAVVLCAAGRTFPVGADIKEFGQPPQPPLLPDLCDRIEACPKPVVAALHGTVLGGGFELALAAHWRLAAENTKLGLPEVTLGIPPGAGGTQRVPRLAGAKAALDLMLSGKPIPASRAEQLGLIDAVVQGADPRAAAVEFAAALLRKGAGRRPTRERSEGISDSQTYAAEIAARRAALAGSHVPAEGRIVDCVEAAIRLPFAEARALERQAFVECLATPQSRALRHAFLAERRAAHVPGLDPALARAVLHAGVVGGGTMGVGIAAALLAAGLPVVLSERDGEARDKAAARVHALIARDLEKQRIDAAEAEARQARLQPVVGLDKLAPCDLVIEAVFEDMAVKRAVFAELDRLVAPEAILATNTSYLDVDALAQSTAHPGRVIGLHFFSPAHVMRLLEIVVGQHVAPATVATAFALAKRLKKIAVRAGVTDGFIGNRVFSAYRTAADFLLEDGASPAEIDAAMRQAGFPLGPYQVQDMAGLDISWARRKRLAPSRDPRVRYVAVGDILCAAGRFGQKSGAGYYRYPDGARAGQEDPEVARIVAEERARKGIVARAVSGDEIRRRILAAMANEGARLVDEKIALRPSDVDVVMLHGYGFPRHLGGPMQWADETGLAALRDDLLRWDAAEPGFWTPAPLWEALIESGGRFGAMA